MSEGRQLACIRHVDILDVNYTVASAVQNGEVHTMIDSGECTGGTLLVHMYNGPYYVQWTLLVHSC